MDRYRSILTPSNIIGILISILVSVIITFMFRWDGKLSSIENELSLTRLELRSAIEKIEDLEELIGASTNAITTRISTSEEYLRDKLNSLQNQLPESQ